MTHELSSDVKELSLLCHTQLEKIFSTYLHNIPSLELKTAMEYCLFSGGKRLRPLLIFATGMTFGAPVENIIIPASAVEMIHTYSLIHDDLPCMDDALLRRGKPTCHNVHGEGIAVLAGDALLTLAMQIIVNQPARLKPQNRLQMIQILSEACGPFGMAAGQALDLSLMDNEKNLSIDLLQDIYRLKTGALFSACIELGWLSSQDDDEQNQQALKRFGDLIGLAFQIQDDILDIEATTQTMGKNTGLDQKNNKITYPKLVGMTEAKLKVQTLYEHALAAINYLGHQAHLLREVTKQMLNRKN